MSIFQPEVCISVENHSEVFDHAHYSDDTILCSDNLDTMIRHIFGVFPDSDPSIALYDNWVDVAIANNAKIHIRVSRCPYDTNLNPHKGV